MGFKSCGNLMLGVFSRRTTRSLRRCSRRVPRTPFDLFSCLILGDIFNYCVIVLSYHVLIVLTSVVAAAAAVALFTSMKDIRREQSLPRTARAPKAKLPQACKSSSST